MRLLEAFRQRALERKAAIRRDLATRVKWALLGAPEIVTAECGAYRGHSLVARAQIARSLSVRARFLGLDSFEGLPPLSTKDLEAAPENIPYRTKSCFADTPIDMVQQTIENAGVKSIRLVAGFFPTRYICCQRHCMIL